MRRTEGGPPRADGPEQILLHMTGLAMSDTQYRNHYVACGPADHNWATLEAMEAEGLVRRARNPGFLPSGDVTFFATEAGLARANRAKAEAERAIPAGRRRYRQWLKVADVMPDMSFGDWLKTGAWRG